LELNFREETCERICSFEMGTIQWRCSCQWC